MGAGAAFWVTGLPGSGKSSLALAAKKAMPGLVILHMDEMRGLVTPEPTYSDLERDLVYRGLVYAALALTREGHDVVIDATANRRVWRELARSHIKDFHEIYVRCPLDICREREKTRIDEFAPKGIYDKGAKGAPVPGVNVPYEEPLKPELVIDTEKMPMDEATRVLAGYVGRRLKS